MSKTSAWLTLGPVYYLWTTEEWRDFYFRIADEAPVDKVVLGEVVCSKRMHFQTPALAAVVERLTAAGKQVEFASLALVTLEREQRLTRDLAQQDDYTVEVNDLSVLPLRKGQPITIGPLVNVYNAPTARFFALNGAKRICLPPELPLDAIRALISAAPAMEFEVFAFGRAPLALSARCAHARVKGNTKDNCQFVCGDDPDGLPVDTLDGQKFLALNGIQTMSYTCTSLLAELPALEAAGVGGFRLSPQRCDMVQIAQLYRDVLDARLAPDEALRQLEALYPSVPLSNGFLHGKPGADWVSEGMGLS